MVKITNEHEAPFGPDWKDPEEMVAFIDWHKEGDQRTIFQTFEDGDLENQIEWWRKGGHLLNQET